MKLSLRDHPRGAIGCALPRGGGPSPHPSLAGHGVDGHGRDGHGVDNHGVDGHDVDGHGRDGHGVDGHGVDGHGVDGHGVDGHGVDGHGVDGRGMDGRGMDGCTLSAATTKIHVSANCFETGSWKDGTWGCTALASSCLGRGRRVPGCSVDATDSSRAGTPQKLTPHQATMSPSPSYSGHPDTALHVGQGGLGEVVLFLSIFILQCA